MSYFKTLSIIVFNVFLVRISENICPEIRLIQPLDELSDLSYVIVTEEKYYMISKDGSIEAENLPVIVPNRAREDPGGALVYFNSVCDPPENYLIVFKFYVDGVGNIYDWNVILNLNNWTNSYKWSRPSRYFPNFLNYNPYINLYRYSFSMLWHKSNNLYLIQMPVPGAPTFRNDYHTIKIGGPNNTCNESAYIEDFNKKIVEILEPYEDFESCFIHNDQQIICFGPKGFSSYDIDLNQTKDGLIRAEGNMTKNFQPIPIMKTIEEIVGVKPETTLTTLPIGEETESDETTSSELLTSNSVEVPEISGTTAETEKSSDDNSMNFWLFLLIILFIVGILLILLLFCLRGRAKQKNELPIDGQHSDMSSELGQTSNTSMRSQFDDKNRLNESTIGSSPSARSETNAEKTKAHKDLSNASTVDDQSPIRSQIKPDNQVLGTPGQSAIDSQNSTRSQTNTNHKKSPIKDMSSASTGGNLSSTRSHIKPDNKNLGTTGKSAIDSQNSMRSQTNTNDKRSPKQDMSSASTINDQPSPRSQIETNTKGVPSNSLVDQND